MKSKSAQPSTTGDARGLDSTAAAAVGLNLKSPGPKTLLHVVHYLLPDLKHDEEGRRFWFSLLSWPPDVFAVSGLLLEETGSYIWAAEPVVRENLTTLRTIPPLVEQVLAWMNVGLSVNLEPVSHARMAEIANREHFATIREAWLRVWDQLATPAREVRLKERDNKAALSLVVDLLFLFTTADETANDLRCIRPYRRPEAEREDELKTARRFGLMALAYLQVADNLATLDNERVQVLTKLSTPKPGVTIRSISRYMALDFSEVEPAWTHIPAFGGWQPSSEKKPHHRSVNLLLLPWPLKTERSWFSESKTKNHFKYEPDSVPGFDVVDFGKDAGSWDFSDLFRYAIDRAAQRVPFLDGVILPELCLVDEQLREAVRICDEYDVPMLVTGVRSNSDSGESRRNEVQTWIRVPGGWAQYVQDKQHRWFLDRDQIRRYGLGAQLPLLPGYWEDTKVPPRKLRFVRIRSGLTFCPLICEDLAREEPAGDLVRAVAPTLILAILLDGPQIPNRWPARHATVLAADPGSAVLTLTSYGLVERSAPPGVKRASRSVALWRDPRGAGPEDIELDEKSIGIVLSATVDTETGKTLDGRSDKGVTSVLSLVDKQSIEQPQQPERPPRKPKRPEREPLPDGKRHSLEVMSAVVEVLVRTRASGDDAKEVIDHYVQHVDRAVARVNGSPLDTGLLGRVRDWFQVAAPRQPSAEAEDGWDGVAEFLVQWAHWTVDGSGFRGA